MKTIIEDILHAIEKYGRFMLSSPGAIFLPKRRPQTAIAGRPVNRAPMCVNCHKDVLDPKTHECS